MNTEPPTQLVCLQCGAILNEIKCKLKCPRCGYFEDCSDGWTNLHQEVRPSAQPSDH